MIKTTLKDNSKEIESYPILMIDPDDGEVVLFINDTDTIILQSTDEEDLFTRTSRRIESFIPYEGVVEIKNI